MPHSTMQQMRAWAGPALFSYGFRPFFFFGALWAGLAMGVWVLSLSGALVIPSAFDPVSWHAHAFLFGYLGAVIAGFLLTAVPNWTGRLPVVGWGLIGLFVLWVLGRVAVTLSAEWSAAGVAATDLAFPVALLAVMLREIVAGRNWRNLMVLGLVALFTVANLIFHIEAAHGDYAAQGYGLRLGLGAAIAMISVIGGRIVPSFTRNWLVRAGSSALPAPPMQRLDKLVLLATAALLLLWVLRPDVLITGAGLVLLGVLHGWRLLRWQGVRTGAEPLVWVLHLAYGLVVLGALLQGLAILWPGIAGIAAAQHLWMAGALGLMTLAVMTRATLGHTGQALHAGAGTTLIYVALLVSVVARIAAGLWPMMALYHLSALGWMGAFWGFAVLYGPRLARARSAA